MDTVKLGNREFDYPLLMLAAGMCKTLEPAAVVGAVRGSDIGVVGSITPQKRKGNTGRQEDLNDALFGLNSWGMPNSGVYEADYTDGVRGPFDTFETPIVVSIAGFSVVDYAYLYRKLLLRGAGLELNFGCPNVRDDGSQHKIASFDPAYIEQILDALSNILRVPNQIIGIKLSPYSDPGLLKEVASVIAIFSDLVDYVASCNTFPNGVGFNEAGKSRVYTDEAGRYGGISGEALKPISLGNSAQLREALPDDIAVIRVGGVSSGRDAIESYKVGCAGVQIGTAYSKEGNQIFHRIRQEMAYADM